MNYTVPFVNAKKHYQTYKHEYEPAIKDVLSRGDLILRKDLEEFEQKIAVFVGTKYALGVNSGFDALHLSLKAAGIGVGDEVITVAHTFVATIAAIVHNGATPILVDVEKDFNMDPEKLKSAITRKTKAVIPVHLNGRICNMGAIMNIARKHKLLVIEDAAQAMGASFKGKRAGSFGTTGCFSLYPFKILGAFGDGGIVTTHNKAIAQKIKWLRDHGQDRAAGKIRMYGFNARLDNLQAAILNVKLRHYGSWIKRRRKIAHLYHTSLRSTRNIILPHFEGKEYFDVYQNYVIRAENRGALKNYLEHCGIETLISWPKPVHHQNALGLRHFHLPETEKLCQEVLSLPMNTEITDRLVTSVASAIKKFYIT